MSSYDITWDTRRTWDIPTTDMTKHTETYFKNSLLVLIVYDGTFLGAKNLTSERKKREIRTYVFVPNCVQMHVMCINAC